MKRRPIVRLAPLALVSLTPLHGCGDAPTEAGPGGVSTEDAQQLDEAAAKLDAESQPSKDAGQKPAN